MVDMMVFVECWYWVWWVGGPSNSSSIMEYGLLVSESSSRSRTRSGPRRSTSDSPPLKEIISSSEILSSSSLFIWLSMTCEKIGVKNCVASLCMVNGVFECVSGTYVFGLCAGNDAICLNVCSGLHDLSFSQGR